MIVGEDTHLKQHRTVFGTEVDHILERKGGGEGGRREGGGREGGEREGGITGDARVL